MPAAEMKAKLLAQIAGEPSPTRRDVGLWQWVVLSALLVLAGLALWVLEPTLGERPVWYVVALVGWWTAIAAAATSLAWGGSRMSGLPRAALLAIVFGGPALLAVVSLAGPYLPGVPQTCFVSPIGARCHRLILFMGVLPLVAALWLKKRTAPTNRRELGAALGVASGSWASAAMALACTCATPAHLLVGHVLPLMVLGAVGAVLGNIFLDVRRA